MTHASSALLAQVADEGALGGARGPAASDTQSDAEHGWLAGLRDAHACARARVWQLGGTPERLTIDLNATLIASHSFGFHPMLAYGDQKAEALAGELRPGNAGANSGADQIHVGERAIGQIQTEDIKSIGLLLRVDSAGASHEAAGLVPRGEHLLPGRL